MKSEKWISTSMFGGICNAVVPHCRISNSTKITSGNTIAAQRNRAKKERDDGIANAVERKGILKAH